MLIPGQIAVLHDTPLNMLDCLYTLGWNYLFQSQEVTPASDFQQ